MLLLGIGNPLRTKLSLVRIFLWYTSHRKKEILRGALDFQMKALGKRMDVGPLRAWKKNLTEKQPELFPFRILESFSSTLPIEVLSDPSTDGLWDLPVIQISAELQVPSNRVNLSNQMLMNPPVFVRSNTKHSRELNMQGPLPSPNIFPKFYHLTFVHLRGNKLLETLENIVDTLPHLSTIRSMDPRGWRVHGPRGWRLYHPATSTPNLAAITLRHQLESSSPNLHNHIPKRAWFMALTDPPCSTVRRMAFQFTKCEF